MSTSGARDALPRHIAPTIKPKMPNARPHLQVAGDAGTGFQVEHLRGSTEETAKSPWSEPVAGTMIRRRFCIVCLLMKAVVALIIGTRPGFTAAGVHNTNTIWRMYFERQGPNRVQPSTSLEQDWRLRRTSARAPSPARSQ